MDQPKLSLGSWAFSFGPFEDNPWPFSRVLQFAAEAGYDGIEINGFRPHPHPDRTTAWASLGTRLPLLRFHPRRSALRAT
jgi:sugar phosphate isomerase/epimerase